MTLATPSLRDVAADVVVAAGADPDEPELDPDDAAVVWKPLLDADANPDTPGAVETGTCIPKSVATVDSEVAVDVPSTTAAPWTTQSAGTSDAEAPTEL